MSRRFRDRKRDTEDLVRLEFPNGPPSGLYEKGRYKKRTKSRKIVYRTDKTLTGGEMTIYNGKLGVVSGFRPTPIL